VFGFLTRHSAAHVRALREGAGEATRGARGAGGVRGRARGADHGGARTPNPEPQTL